MTLNEIQRDVNEWAQQFNPAYWLPLEQLARLAEEVGELAREVNHVHGAKKKKANESESSIGKELSDVIFTVCCIANREGIDMQKEWEEMMEKKQYGRDNNRFEKKLDN